MRKKILWGGIFSALVLSVCLYAADHIDAPAVTGPNSTSKASDITDVYAFQSPENANNLVFVMNTQGLLAPIVTGTAKFDNNVMYELNIDNTGDNQEDLVIQFLHSDGKMRVYGPAAPAQKGLISSILTTGPTTDVDVSQYGGTVNIGNNSNGIKVFAGPRDDPFFFDLAQFKKIIAGTASSFNNPGADTFAGTNVMSLIVEVPKTLLGSATTLNVWAESKTKQ